MPFESTALDDIALHLVKSAKLELGIYLQHNLNRANKLGMMNREREREREKIYMRARPTAQLNHFGWRVYPMIKMLL